MQNDAWRLYRPVFSVVPVAKIARLDGDRAERAQSLDANHQKLHAGRSRTTLATIPAVAAIWADQYLVHCRGEWHRADPSIT